MNGVSITDATNPPAGIMSDGDAFWISQGGASTLSVGLLSQLATYLQGKLATAPKRRVEEVGSASLSFARHHRSLVTFPNGGTVSVASFSDCGDGFECEILNTSSGVVTIGSGVICSGMSSLQPKQGAQVRAVVSNGASSVFAQTQVASGSVPSINVGAIANQLANSSFTVAGTLGSYGAPPTLSYTNDGGASWSVLPSGSVITSTSFSFINPGMAARSSATIQVRDGLSTIGSSNSFAVESASFGALPGFVTGQSGNVLLSLAGLPIAYLAWWNGGEVGTRVAVSAGSALITAPAVGSYTIRLSDSPSGGLLLAESSAITVSATGLMLPSVSAFPSLYLNSSNSGQSVGAVTTILDQSGSGNILSVSGGTPTLSANVQNGKPGLLVSGGAVPFRLRVGRPHAGGHDGSGHGVCCRGSEELQRFDKERGF